MKVKSLAVGAALALTLFVSTAGTASAQYYHTGPGYRVNGYNYYGPRYTNNNYRPYSNGYGYGYSPYYAPAIYSPAFSTGYYGNSYGYGNSFGYSRGYGYGGYPGYGYGGSGFSFSIGGFR